MPVRQHDVPEEILTLSTLKPPDYVDLFVATSAGADRTSPEDWARAAMEGASELGRFLAWRVCCGFDLHQEPSPDHIAGWRIDGRGEHWIRTEARSWFMTAQIVFTMDQSQVWFTTLIRYDRPIAAWIWGTVSHVHRAVAPGFLAGAVRRVERGRPSPGQDAGRPR